MRKLLTVDYQTLSHVKGPLLFVENVKGAGLGELVDIIRPDGEILLGQVLEVDQSRAIVQVFAPTQGLNIDQTRVRFTGEVTRLGVSLEMLGRTFGGSGQTIDGGPPITPEEYRDINGSPINPASRDHPSEFIQTGISAIDGLNTLVRGQKLPIFSGFGLPANELAAQIASQARVLGSKEKFAVVFAAVGITYREATFFIDNFEQSETRDRTLLFLNLANDPTVERLLVPRYALTAAEYLAFAHGMQVLVIMTDILNYTEALREVSSAREEVPGRRGYPGYMYTDLSTIYERAGRIKGKAGSVTQLIILTMPDDDITHPVPDLTGYITEGQIVLSRDLHRRGIYPPVDVLPSLSRLMNAGIGSGKTREDHRNVADQLYAIYAQGRDLRRLVAIIGEAALSVEDRRYIKFADELEQKFISQGETNRSIEDTLELAWELFKPIPTVDLKRISQEFIERFGKRKVWSNAQELSEVVD